MSEKQVLLITGANTGIGLETVKALLESPIAYHILLSGRSIEKAKDAVSTLESSYPNASSSLEALQLDITSDDSISAAVAHIESVHKRLDVLVNNAGASFDSQIDKTMTVRQAHETSYSVNVISTHILTTALVPLLLASPAPRLLFLTSGLSNLTTASEGVRQGTDPRIPVAGWPKPGPAFTAYRVSKTGLNMLMLEWARMLKNDGVKVWAISPGMLATGLGGNPELLKKMGAGDPKLGGDFIREVVEGKRDEDVGKVVCKGGVQDW